VSEYTNYFAIKTDKIETVIDRLKKAKIMCFVDTAEYLEDHPVKYDGGIWVVVTVYAEMQWSDGNYYFDFKLEEISEMFEKVVSLYEHEDANTWEIKVYLKSHKIFESLFKYKKHISFPKTQLNLFSQCY